MNHTQDIKQVLETARMLDVINEDKNYYKIFKEIKKTMFIELHKGVIMITEKIMNANKEIGIIKITKCKLWS